MAAFTRSLLTIALALASTALAADDASEVVVEAAPVAPPAPKTAPVVRAVGFVDRAPDCDPVAAWYGRCVERVDFLDLSDAWREGAQPDREERATWRGIGALFARIWEDVALRWGMDEDALKDTLGKAGVTTLPLGPTLWDSTARGQRRSYALPDRALWLDDPTWRTQAGGGTPWFPNLNLTQPSGVPAPDAIALLRGRFASRLAYDGRLHPYDMMDGDPGSSGPFHEQMYPFQTALASGDPTLQPLRHFVSPEALKREGLNPNDSKVAEARAEAFRATTFAASQELSGARELAIEEFHRFYHLVGTQIVRFALEEFTPTHMRVLSTLVAMDVPPTLLTEGAIARDVVAASEGQTDDESLIQSLIQDEGAGGVNPEGVDYSQLPDKVVDAWLSRFPERADPPVEIRAALDKDVSLVLQDILRPGARGPTRLDDEGLQAWVEESALPGRAADIQKHVRRLLLRALVEHLPEDLRAEARSRLVLDHVEVDLSARFDPTPGYRATPADLENSAGARWKSVLGRHGFAPHPIADGPGAVAPTAICTTRDRKAALTEPVFGAVDVDVLVVAADGLKRADEVLWQARKQSPFLLMDDPSVTRPVVARLVGLPDGSALYRARWRIWSGWHLLWGVEQVGPESERLVLRTGAICEDTVLAPPDLIPTLARAALLEGDQRAVHPIRGLSRDEREAIEADERARRGIGEKQIRSADQVVGGGAKAAGQASSASFGVSSSVDAVEETPTAADDVAEVQGNRLSGLVDRPADRRRLPVTEALDTVTYIQGLMRAPLYALAAARRAEGDPALALAVFSTRIAAQHEATWRLLPDTPYERTEERAGPGRRALTAAWLVMMDDAAEQAPMLAPAYRPTASVSAGAPEATWRRVHKIEFALDGGLAALPLRSSVFGCSDDVDVLAEVNALSTVAPCHPGEADVEAETSAMLVDLSAPVALWLFDEPRLAGELGPVFQLTLLPPGQGLLWPEGEPTYTWTWSARGGLVAGLRLLGDPRPLVRLGDRSPWGADHPDGSADLGRWAAGLRVSGMLGPGFNGLEGTAGAELWGAASLRSDRSVAASFTPWHPILWLGPYATAQITGVLAGGDEPRYYELHRRTELIIGVRGQVRLSEKPGNPPEAE